MQAQEWLHPFWTKEHHFKKRSQEENLNTTEKSQTKDP